MKFSASVDVNQPQAMVAKYFADPQYLHEYQEGFVKKELVSGEAGEDGAVSNMYYKQGKRELELTETIRANRLPDSFEAFYHHKHMDNTMLCRFIPLSDNQTRYEAEFEYTRVSWIMPRLMMTLFPGMFRRQGEKWMQNFKAFVEKQGPA